MRHLNNRKWLVGVVAFAMVAAPITLAELGSWGTAGASVSVDTVTYNQTTTSSVTSVAYVPGDGSAVTTQTMAPASSGDNDQDDCIVPTPPASPVLALSALTYNHLVGGVAYTGTPSTAKVGVYKGATGVCGNWDGTNASIKQNQSLTFTVGPNALVAGRVLTEAKIPLKTDSNCGSCTATVTLVERRGAAVVATQHIVVSGGSGTTATADTGKIVAGFTSVELQVTTTSSRCSISVVGPAAVFSFIQLPQTITFTNAPPAMTAPGDSYTVTATASSGLPVTLSVDSLSTSGCTIDPSTGIVTVNGPVGSCIIDANQPGNALYSPAPQVQQTVGVAQLPQTITFTNSPPSSPSVGDTYTVTATASSGLAVTLSVDSASSSGCTIDPSTGIVTLGGPAGSCIVDANQAGSARYLAAPQVQQPVAVEVASQTIGFTSTPPASPLIGDTYTVTANSSSGLPVDFSIDSNSTSGCTVDATGLVTFTAPSGSCIIDANQQGNGSYAPAPQQQQTVTVFQSICGQQTINAASTDGTVTSGQITASITFQDYNGQPAPPTVCKDYQSFTATTNDPIPSIGGTQTVSFDSSPLPTAHLTATIVWAIQGICTPDGSAPGPQCPPTYVSFDHGATWVPQTFCTSAQTAGIQWCTTSKTYKYTGSGVQITEEWDGYGDPLFHNAS